MELSALQQNNSKVCKLQEKEEGEGSKPQAVEVGF